MTSEPVTLRLDLDPRALRGPRGGAWPALVAVLDHALVELAVAGARHRLDRANLALVPAGARYALASRSPTARVVTLGLGPGARDAAARAYAPALDRRRFARVLAAPRLLPRTRWLDELLHRYVFERATCGKHASAAARFLETELAKELYFVGAEQLAPRPRARASVVHEEDVVARRARAYLEANLFAPLRVAALARHCHASESTLLRAFRRELGVAPSAYLRARRLDEARLLLRAGGPGVGEVAARVGYRTLAAFTAAFRRRFGELPSAVRAAGR